VLEALAAGLPAVGSDLRDRTGAADWFVHRHNFLTSDADPVCASVIMNPPYLEKGQGSEPFIRKAMSFPSVQKIAAFVPSKFLWGGDRARDFWTKLPPARVYLITPRPSCPPGPVIEAGISPGGGFEDFAWCVWDKGSFATWEAASQCGQAPVLRWILGPDRRKGRVKR